MDFSANKQDTYEKRIASLPDQPNMQPNELKAYFDSSPEQLRQAHNGLCDALTEATSAAAAAANLGFQRTAGVPADTVQAAVENVQQQVTDAVLGNIPSGSVTQDKLAQDVRDRFTAIENAAAAESTARASADSAETTARTNADNNLQTQINAKCEVVMGSYTGDNAESRTISLGFTPKAVLIISQGALLCDDNGMVYGGLALANMPCIAFLNQDTYTTAIEIVDGGFRVACKRINYSHPDGAYTNNLSTVFFYIAIK